MNVFGLSRFDAPRDDDSILTMVGEQTLQIQEIYQKKVMPNASAEVEGKTCWPVDWFPEHMPTESANGNSVYYYLQNVADPLCFDGGQWPPVDQQGVQQEDVLIFCDSYGYCKEILEQAPPGRIGLRNVQNKNISSYDDKTMKKLVTSHQWDLIIYAFGIDPPASNSVDDVLKHQDAVLKPLLSMLKLLSDDPNACKRLCILTVDTFAMEKEIHEECGIGLVTNSTLFGMANTARVELAQIPVQFIDTEWSLRTENTKYLVAEIFRQSSFGHNTVRILNKGRYVQRMVPAKPYENLPNWQLPQDGVIAITGGNGALGLVMGLWILKKVKEQGGKHFEIKFLSRRGKVTDESNLKNWHEIQSQAQEIGIRVEQAICDVSNRSAVDQFVFDMSPNLTGIIHSAGILQDSMLMNQTWDKFDAVFGPKSRAALYIHDALEKNENPNFLFFWMFSSQAVYGSMGQLNYAASNAFLDGIARHRRAIGKPAMAPQWGAWGDVGMAANLDDANRRRMMNSPTPYFSNAEGLFGLECGLRSNFAHFQVFKIRPDMYFGMIFGDDGPLQCYTRNWSSAVIPPPPGDPQKNPYSTITYTLRKQCHVYHKALLYQHYWPEKSEREAYEEE